MNHISPRCQEPTTVRIFSGFNEAIATRPSYQRWELETPHEAWRHGVPVPAASALEARPLSPCTVCRSIERLTCFSINIISSGALNFPATAVPWFFVRSGVGKLTCPPFFLEKPTQWASSLQTSSSKPCRTEYSVRKCSPLSRLLCSKPKGELADLGSGWVQASRLIFCKTLYTRCTGT